MSAPQDFNTHGTSQLPTPRQLVTSIVISIPAANPLASASPCQPLDTQATKELFLTLHVLFPNELLPALDLLDRGLIIRHRLRSPGHADQAHRDEESQHPRPFRQCRQREPSVPFLPGRTHPVQRALHSANPQDDLQPLPSLPSLPSQVGQGETEARSACHQGPHDLVRDAGLERLQDVDHQDQDAERATHARDAAHPIGVSASGALAASSGAERGGASGHVARVTTYYVRSAQQQSSRGGSRYRNAVHESTTHHEVRLDAWSCSCPAFAFSAFPASASSDNGTDGRMENIRHLNNSEYGWLFGGLTRGTDMSVCKHLLACVLVEHCTTFSHMVEEREVTSEEMAGWAAGWGD